MTQHPKSDSIHYTQNYFTDRDVLDAPVAEGIKQFMHDHELNTVLDVGCGTGKIVKFLNDSGFDAIGCDVSTIAVKMAQKLCGKKRVTHASATNFPYQAQTFDLIICVSVIEHISKKQVDRFLRESTRILKPGGYIFLVTPNFAAPLRLLQGKQWGPYSDPTHINFYTPANLVETLQLNGFSQTNSTIGIRYKDCVSVNYLAKNRYLPDFLKSSLCYLLFSTPFRFIRNSFWMSARKARF